MNYALSSPSNSRRGSLLAIIVALHAGVIALIAVARTIVPQIEERPLIVELLQAPPLVQKQPEAKPLPVSKPQTLRQAPTPVPQAPTPAIEATSSTVPAPSAPVAAPSETRPDPAPAPSTAEPISQARFDADYLRNPSPPYPPLSRRLGEEGKVILRVSVTPQGTADNIEIKTSSGSARLDEAAQKTVRNWKFVAAKRGETPIQSWVLVPIIFKLEQ